MLIHTSSVAINDFAVLIAGPSGSGKSDLALRLIDEGAELIADDQTVLTGTKDKLIASAPETIQGLFEVRHVGLLKLPFALLAEVRLYVELVPLNKDIERLPDNDFIELEGFRIQRLHLPSFAASTPAKIRAALKYTMASI